MNPSCKLLFVEVNMPPDPERWARQRDLALRPPATSRQEVRPTANLGLLSSHSGSTVRQLVSRVPTGC
jgi:hypothetical protein